MKYKYSIKIHNVIDYSELENVMNDYGSNKYRKKHKADVLWTCTESALKTLKESLKKYDNQL